MILNDKSKERLDQVHPDLVRVVYRAAEITTLDFIITEGARSLEKQKKLKESGASQTMKSRHVPMMNECGDACAVDLAAVVDGEVRWDWPLYAKLNEVMQEAAEIEGVHIEWGGAWKTLKDGPHFQLPWSTYP